MTIWFYRCWEMKFENWDILLKVEHTTCSIISPASSGRVVSAEVLHKESWLGMHWAVSSFLTQCITHNHWHQKTRTIEGCISGHFVCKFRFSLESILYCYFSYFFFIKKFISNIISYIDWLIVYIFFNENESMKKCHIGKSYFTLKKFPKRQ